jgi:hypothetical protein
MTGAIVAVTNNSAATIIDLEISVFIPNAQAELSLGTDEGSVTLGAGESTELHIHWSPPAPWPDLTSIRAS